METFAKRITNLRLKNGLTQKQVAESLGVPLSTYKEWEYGRKIQGEEYYVRMSEVFSVSIRNLLTGEQTQQQEDLLARLQVLATQLQELKSALISVL
jgi:transcriptional regulator with XRE-family HTH domain